MISHIFYLLIFITFNSFDILPHHAFKCAELLLGGKQNFEENDLTAPFLETLSSNNDPRSYYLLCQDMQMSENILFRLNKDEYKKRNQTIDIANRIIYCELLTTEKNNTTFHVNVELDRFLNKLLSVCEKNNLEKSFAIIVKHSKKYHVFRIDEGRKLYHVNNERETNDDVKNTLEHLINNTTTLKESIEKSRTQQYSTLFANSLSSSTTQQTWNQFTISRATYFCLIITLINLIYDRQSIFRIIEKGYSRLL